MCGIVLNERRKAPEKSGGLLLLGCAGALVARTLSLPGGVTVSIPAMGAETWSYPNLHGDIVVTGDGDGLRATGIALYDPFGQPLDRATGGIGTIAADDSGPTRTPTTSGSASTRSSSNTLAASPPSRWEHGNTSRRSAGSWKSTPSRAESTTTTGTRTTRSMSLTSTESSRSTGARSRHRNGCAHVGASSRNGINTTASFRPCAAPKTLSVLLRFVRWPLDATRARSDRTRSDVSVTFRTDVPRAP